MFRVARPWIAPCLAASIWLISCASAAIAHPALPAWMGPTSAAWNNRVYARVRAFLGPTRGRYDILAGERTAYATFVATTNFDWSTKFPTKGGTIYYGCRLHECFLHGGVLLDTADRVHAVGLIDLPCSPPSVRPYATCEERYRLRIFVRRSHEAGPAIEAMRIWARSQTGHEMARAQGREPAFEVIWLRNNHALGR